MRLQWWPKSFIVSMIGPEYSSMTEWERQKEWKEFTHAARVYQPLTTSLASKFTRAQAVEDKEERPKVHSTHTQVPWPFHLTIPITCTKQQEVCTLRYWSMVLPYAIVLLDCWWSETTHTTQFLAPWLVSYPDDTAISFGRGLASNTM